MFVRLLYADLNNRLNPFGLNQNALHTHSFRLHFTGLLIVRVVDIFVVSLIVIEPGALGIISERFILTENPE